MRALLLLACANAQVHFTCDIQKEVAKYRNLQNLKLLFDGRGVGNATLGPLMRKTGSTTMQRFAGLAELGRASLRSGERRALADLLDQNFDLRASFWSLREVDHQLVEIGRRVGAGVKFAGSGGAVVGLLHHEQDWPKLRRAYREAGLDVIRPTLGEAS